MVCSVAPDCHKIAGPIGPGVIEQIEVKWLVLSRSYSELIRPKGLCGIEELNSQLGPGLFNSVLMIGPA
jgi:hypothetical protein